MDYHCFADDTQVYLVIEHLDKWTDISSRIEACLADISNWMRSNLLKLNQDKTEFIVFAPKPRVKDFSDCRLSFDGTVYVVMFHVSEIWVYFSIKHSVWRNRSVPPQNCAFIKLETLDAFEPTLLTMLARPWLIRWSLLG
jgi:hypothetical protein